MSEPTNSSPTLVQTTFLSNPDLNFIEIVSLLGQEKQLNNFSKIIASITPKLISETIAELWGPLLVFNPQLEAVIDIHTRKTLFRDDWNYYTLLNGNSVPFNPFTHHTVTGDVWCTEDDTVYYTKKFLEESAGRWEWVYIPNPLLAVMIADLLTIMLNREQKWLKEYRSLPCHPMQNYISLDKFVDMVPNVKMKYISTMNKIAESKQDFIFELLQSKQKSGAFIDNDEVEKIYAARGKNDTEILIQDFWDSEYAQLALNEIQTNVEALIVKAFPQVRSATERSLCEAYGYDVYEAVVSGPLVLVKSLGDYRILHWEMN